MNKLNVCEVQTLPMKPDIDTVYRLTPITFDEKVYRERTDRNIGWITQKMQDMLYNSVVCVAGCGGMGGLVASVLYRLGVGEIRIADPEVFDTSNINRQLAARLNSVGHQKAFETTKEIRRIGEDTTVMVYPQGICEDTIDHFLDGGDIVLDLIEFWSVGARVLTHLRARQMGLTLLNVDVVGCQTNVFKFTCDSMTVEEALGMSYGEAKDLESKFRNRSISKDEYERVMNAVIRVFVPQFPEYSPDVKGGTKERVLERLWGEGVVSILATTPPMSAGVLQIRMLMELLVSAGFPLSYTPVPEMPGCLTFDAAHWDASKRNGPWW